MVGPAVQTAANGAATNNSSQRNHYWRRANSFRRRESI